MAAMERTGTSKLKFESEGIKLELEHCGGAVHEVIREVIADRPRFPVQMNSPVRHPVIENRIDPMPEVPAAPTGNPGAAEQKGKFASSPIVGTFYASSAPGADPFVKVGDRVDENSVIGIVEAMKVMNEVKAGVSGTVKEILARDGDLVEYGTKLVRVE